jgi:hypothetical protein
MAASQRPDTRLALRKTPESFVWNARGYARPDSDQQPRQTDDNAFPTFASSRSTPALVPSSGPFAEALPKPLVESAVPAEFVPGELGLSPNAPPVTGMPVMAEE